MGFFGGCRVGVLWGVGFGFWWAGRGMSPLECLGNEG